MTKKNSKSTEKEQLVRVNADFQNYKKRVEKEKLEWMDFAKADVIEAFLPIKDDLERALQVCKDSKVIKDKTWIEGFALVYKKLNKVFSDLKIKEIDCSKGFDPEYHEALIQIDSKDHKSGQIVQVLNKGYIFKDKVLRHAKVSVAK